jgi:hypothetical protein
MCSNKNPFAVIFPWENWHYRHLYIGSSVDVRVDCGVRKYVDKMFPHIIAAIIDEMPKYKCI